MSKFIFTIEGNQEKKNGNPIPYVRVVGRALWLPSARRYAAWKVYVRKCFYKHYPKMLIGKSLSDRPLSSIDGEISKRMDIKIYWSNKVHADNDNIFKGISDALFEKDKNLNGSFESQYCPEKKGRVEVVISG